ncbi:hypothetical protein EC957_010454 [Mortierella hygrophila]|uniref:Uncharacterized protein n=1 Tax=Mortierella hygrophila TaxID=979708 RepID=A0A9P6FAW1_9FUNG|nr:hypothetical protein EC957_010454 [Mortierella hygrophila]
MDPPYTTPSTPPTTRTTEPVTATVTTTEPVSTITTTTIESPTTTTTTTTTIEPPPTTSITTTEPPPPTTTTTEPPPTTTRTRTTRTRTPINPTTSSHTTITTNSDPITPTTSSSTTSIDTIISPTLPSGNETGGGGISSGAIIGIVLVALLALIAGLISAFLIKRRRRRRFNQTSDTLFNPVNNNATLAMQENQNYHPATSPRKDYPSGGGGGGGLRGRESVEPLNAQAAGITMLGNNTNNRVSSGGSDNSGSSSAIAAASGFQQDSLYPFEADPARYYHSGTGVNYTPPTEPAYSQYGGWNDLASSSEYSMMPGVHPTGEYHTDPAEAEAYAQYEQEQRDMYLHQLMMMQQHGQDQGEYYDPQTSTDYYSSSVYPQPPPVMAHSSQLQHQSHHPQYDEDRAAPVPMASGSVMSTPLIAATAMAPALLPTPTSPTSTSVSFPGTQSTPAATASTPSSAVHSPSLEPQSVRRYYDLTENDVAYNTKSEPWASPKRNPQVLVNPATAASSSSVRGARTRETAAGDQSKVFVSGDSPYASDAMTRPM